MKCFALRLDSFWNRGTRELGNGPLHHVSRSQRKGSSHTTGPQIMTVGSFHAVIPWRKKIVTYLVNLIVLSFIYLFNLIFILPFVFAFCDSAAEFRLFRQKPQGLCCFKFVSYFPFTRSTCVLFNSTNDNIIIKNLSKISIKCSEDVFLWFHLEERWQNSRNWSNTSFFFKTSNLPRIAVLILNFKPRKLLFKCT